MLESCSLARKDTIGALYFEGRLVIWATGKKPSPCYTVSVRESLLPIFPPEYELVWCVKAGIFCPQIIVPYQVEGVFYVPFQKEVTVRYQDGTDTVPVVKIPDLAAAGKAATQPALGGGGHEVPSPFRLAKVFQTGKSEDIEGIAVTSPRRATGYSFDFSFEEAYQDAVRKLPPPTSHHNPDVATTVVVEEIGGIYGGFIGAAKMFVKVVSD
jgi:hypothetical protein